MNLENEIEAVKAKLAELEQAHKEQQERESKKPWRAKKGEWYYCVNEYGMVRLHRESNDEIDNALFEKGNYFRTEEAKNSPLYFFMNSEYNYWLPDMPKPKELPAGCEFFDCACWRKETDSPDSWTPLIRRYPKHPKGE